MQVHGSCIARDGAGVLLLGPSGSGKSDLVLRLLDYGFRLVADDRVDIVAGIARAPATLEGLLEVRGLGILCLPHADSAMIELVADCGLAPERMPCPARHHVLGVPIIGVNATAASAPSLIGRALDCALGHTRQLAGAFVP